LAFEAEGFFLVLLLKGGQFEFTQRIDVKILRLAFKMSTAQENNNILQNVKQTIAKKETNKLQGKKKQSKNRPSKLSVLGHVSSISD